MSLIRKIKTLMKTLIYIKRSLKFLAALMLLYFAAIWVMHRTGATMLAPRDTMQVLWLTWRGRVLVCAVVVWSALYPLVGFVRRTVAGDTVRNREQIVNAFVRSGYELARTDGERMVFRASNIFRKVRLLFEDEVEVRQQGDEIVIEGIRRTVAEAAMRLKSYLEHAGYEG